MSERNSRVKRVTDLFVEGTELPIGVDETGQPVLIWVQKLNPFETEEARRDGTARRGQRLAELASPDSPDHRGLRAEIGTWSDQQLAEHYVSQRAEEIYLEVMNDLTVDPDWRERNDRIQRLPELLDAAGAAPDDPRRLQLAEDQEAWLRAITEGQERRSREMLQEARELDREALIDAFVENWRQRETLDVFMEERRVTELYYALRDCTATDVSTTVGAPRWDHSGCDHSERIFTREEVRGLPEGLILKAQETLDNLRIPAREAGNSDAPASSSASSEPSSEPEAPSTLSTPDETPSAAPTS